MNGKIKTFFALALVFAGLNAADASKLPDDVWAYVKKEIPNSTQRFDSVVMMSDGNMYIPLYPAERKNVDNITTEYTYPKGAKLSSKPEVFILNNNYVFLKAFKDSKGNYTVTKYEDLPVKVKLGVMPQDMLVPTGLNVPEHLKITMGDLLIPSRGDNLLITTSDSVVGEEEDNADIVPIVEFRNTKAFFANNKTKFILVYDQGGTKPLYEIKLSGLPNKIIASPLTKFALTIYFGSKTAEVIDLVNERVLTTIDFEDIPQDADLDKINQLAYVTSAKTGTIYVVDLNSGSLAKTIKTDRAPDKISVSGKDNLLVFNDKNNENVYLMNTKDNEVKNIGEVKNLSTLLIGDNRVLAISRTKNKAYVYQISDFKNDIPASLVSELDLGEKPTDAVIYNNKAFILCSKAGIVNVYDFEQDRMLESIPLGNDGFYSKITLIPNKNNAAITGINTKKIIIINLDSNKQEKKASANIDVSDLVIIDNQAPVLPKPKQKEEQDDI